MTWYDAFAALRGCAGLAALATSKIPRRRTPFNFKTGSKRNTQGAGRLFQGPTHEKAQLYELRLLLSTPVPGRLSALWASR
jgi:hypothetical protein